MSSRRDGLPNRYPPGADTFHLSVEGPSPALWCLVCSLYFPLTSPDDTAEQRSAKTVHVCNRRQEGWL